MHCGRYESFVHGGASCRDAVVRIVKKSEYTKYLAYYTRAGVERNPVYSLSYSKLSGEMGQMENNFLMQVCRA